MGEKLAETKRRAPDAHDQPLPLPGGEPVLPHALRSIDAVAGGAGLELAPGAVASLRAELAARIQIGAQRYGQELRTDDGRDAARDLREEALDAYLYAIRGWLQSAGEWRQRYTRAAMHALGMWEALRLEDEEEGDDE